MSSQNIAANAASASSNAGAGNRVSCTKCNKTFGMDKHLKRHMRGHDLPYKCRFCDKRFGRGDQVPRHEHLIHNQNSSAHICHIEGCTRLRFGFRDEDTLIQHLQQIHDGATMADNEQAKMEQGHDRANNPASGAADRAQGSSSDNDEDNESSEDEPSHWHESPPSASHRPAPAHDEDLAEKDNQIEHLQEQMQEERDGHLMEIADIHRSYKAKLEELSARAMTETKDEVLEEIIELCRSISTS
ncbi:uncharacterized protein PG986_003904 [Apiospora aurea]|uniref:C2H2-type domain-containing protein n=1 Tax=Apiospora aurea TaxID=335848 RepID=A0ABR1QLU6_9PEZI